MKKRMTQSIRLEANAKQKHADLYLFGVIGSWWENNTAQDILNELQANQSLETIRVHLSSVGGNFLDGLPIYNLLKNHPAEVTTQVIGYALSMGSVIMLAGDRIECAQNGLIMIHNAQGFALGDKHLMRKEAQVLDKHEKAILPRYQERLGQSADAVQALLDEETWYTADEALAAGLIDAVTDPVDLDQADKQQPENAWQQTQNFKHPPEQFKARVAQAMQQHPSWFDRLVANISRKPDHEHPTDEVDEMTKDEMAEVLAANNQALMDGLVTALQPEPALMEGVAAVQAELASKTSELEALRAENADLKQQVAELSEPALGNPPPVNTGPAKTNAEHFA